MLKSEEIKKIEDFVAIKPRSVQDIAELLEVSWRTADRYVDQIKTDFGTVDTAVFREGTRGALKIVYLAGVEKVSHSIFQEELEKEILRARRKEDFSAFDIFQHIPDKNKKARIKKSTESDPVDISELAEQMLQAKKQVLLFSGNLSFINLKDKKHDMLKVIEELVRRGITIKVLCRVDIAGRDNIEKALSLNFKHGQEQIEIRHREHPIRAAIIDSKFFRIKEIKEPTGKQKELDKKLFIFYTVRDKEWTEWLSRVFWKMFSQSIDANKRLEELNKLK